MDDGVAVPLERNGASEEKKPPEEYTARSNLNYSIMYFNTLFTSKKVMGCLKKFFLTAKVAGFRIGAIPL